MTAGDPSGGSLRVVVLLGGTSEERDVSIASGARVTSALRSRGHSVAVVDASAGPLSDAEERSMFAAGVGRRPPRVEGDHTASRPPWLDRLVARLPPCDVVFLALHGGSGEDGRVQAVLDAAGIRYTGSSAEGSERAMRKDVAKGVLRAAGLDTPDWAVGGEGETGESGLAALAGVTERIGFPMIVKPAAQGSSVGLSIARDTEGLARAADLARPHGAILYERFVAGRELTVGVLEGEALAVGEIGVDPDAALSYTAKYQGEISEVFPAAIDDDLRARLRSAALLAHRELGLRHYSRSDFRLDAAGKPWLLEVNTLPGLTSTSLFPQSAAAAGIRFDELCERLCLLALADD